MEPIEIDGKKVIKVNDDYYYIDDITKNINNFGLSGNYKYWDKAGQYAIKDSKELFGELQTGDLEYNGSYFIDHKGRDRNNPKNKKNLIKGSSYNNGLYRTAGATILKYAIDNSTPINLKSEDDFRDFVEKTIKHRLGDIEDFLNLDKPSDENTTYGIKNRYTIVAKTLLNIRDNLNKYGILYTIPGNFEKDLSDAYNAFNDLTTNGNEVYLLNLLLINPNKGIDKAYFETNFSTPLQVDTDLKDEEDEESDTIKTDPYMEYVNNYFTDNDFKSFSHNTNKISSKVLKIPTEGLKKNLINLLCGALFKDSEHSKSYSKVLEVFKKRGITEDDFLRYLLSKSIKYRFAKKINNTNSYYIPSIRYNKKLVFTFKIENNKTLGGFTNFINIPGFNEKLKTEYEKNPNIDINKFIEEFFV